MTYIQFKYNSLCWTSNMDRSERIERTLAWSAGFSRSIHNAERKSTDLRLLWSGCWSQNFDRIMLFDSFEATLRNEGL